MSRRRTKEVEEFPGRKRGVAVCKGCSDFTIIVLWRTSSREVSEPGYVYEPLGTYHLCRACTLAMAARKHRDAAARLDEQQRIATRAGGARQDRLRKALSLTELGQLRTGRKNAIVLP